MTESLLVGAVAYDPKVVTIWSGFRTWLRSRGVEMDYVLYSNYERQTEDLVAGRLDLAWHSPLAWVRTLRLAAASGAVVRGVAMRDTDQDLVSVVLVRSESPAQEPADLTGTTIAVGAIDSPQATLLPLSTLRAGGLDLDAVEVLRFDVGVGLHGDHIGGERDAVRALLDGTAEAACTTDSNLLLFGQEGLCPPGSVRVVARTDRYDHCMLTAGPRANDRLVSELVDQLLAISYADPEARRLLDLEGLRQWRPGRTVGYAALERAVDETYFYDRQGVIGVADYRY